MFPRDKGGKKHRLNQTPAEVRPECPPVEVEQKARKMGAETGATPISDIGKG